MGPSTHLRFKFVRCGPSYFLADCRGGREEALILSIEELYSIYITDMLDMAEGRALGGAKLSSIAIVGPGGVMPGKDVFKLRDYVTRVDYRVQLNDAPLDRELSS